MSIEINNKDRDVLQRLLSGDRLARLERQTGSTEAAIVQHQRSLRLNASLMLIIGTIEIALRNAAFENLKLHFDASDWILRPPVPFSWRKPEISSLDHAKAHARNEIYANLSNREKSKLDNHAYPTGVPPNLENASRDKKRKQNISVSHTQIIAQLSLGSGPIN